MLRRSILMILAVCFLLSCAARRERLEQEEAQRVQQLLESSASYYSQQGEAALRAGDYDQAISSFRKAISILPTDAKNHNNLGVAFYRNEQLDSALVYYQNAIRFRSTYAQAYINLGYLYVDVQEYGHAETAAQQAYNQEPDAAAVSLLAFIFEKQGKFDRAEANYQKAVELEPRHVLFHQALAAFYYDRGRLDEAIAAYENAASLAPENADIYYNLGNCYARQCHLQQAQDLYEHSFQLNPKMLGALNNHGLILVQKEEYEEALENFYRALAVDSTAAPVLFNISIALLKENDPQTALIYAERAIKNDSTFAMFFVQLGNIYLDLGQTDSALSAFNKAVALDAGYAMAYNNIGNALLEKNNAEAAQQAYQQALGLYPDFLQKKYFSQGEQLSNGVGDLFGGCVDAEQLLTDYAMMTNNLGRAKLIVGLMDEASEYFERAINSQPDLVQPYENLAYIYQQQGKTAERNRMMAFARLNEARHLFAADSLAWALDACDAALTFYPDLTPALALKARIQLKQNNTTAAQRVLDTAVAVNPNDPTVQFAYAEFLAKQLKFEAAARHAEKAVDLDPYHINYRELYADISDSLGQSRIAALQRAYSYYLSGKKRELVGQWDLALDAYQSAAGLADDAAFFAAQGHIYVKKHLYVEAELLLQQALDMNPDHVDALYGMGLLDAEKADYEQAIAYLERAVDHAEENPHIHYALAMSYFNAGEGEKAAEHLKSAQDLGLVIDPAVLARVGR